MFSVIFLSLLVGFVYTFQTISVSSCFPIASHGIIFASMEVIGSLANFGQIPLTDKVKLDQNFDSAAWFCTLLNIFVILCFPVILIVTFKMNNKWIQRLDAPRAQAGFQNLCHDKCRSEFDHTENLQKGNESNRRKPKLHRGHQLLELISKSLNQNYN